MNNKFLSHLTIQFLKICLAVAFALNGVIPLDLKLVYAASPPVQTASVAPIVENLSLLEKIRNLDLSSVDVEKIKEGQNRDSVLVLIRDLHCQEDAQVNIARAIEKLKAELGIQDVFIEGAHGSFDLSLYAAFPDLKVRDRVARNFVKQGYLTGAEYSALRLGLENPLQLYGVENPQVYVENLKAFRDVRKSFRTSKKALNVIERSIQEVADKIYSEELKTWVRYRNMLHSGKDFKIEEIVLAIENSLKRKNKSPEGDLKGLLQIIKMAISFDEKKLNKEREDLLNQLGKSLVKEELKELIKLNLEYRIGRISGKEYLERLKSDFEKRGSSFASAYPELDKWLQLEILQEKFNFRNKRIWDELDQLISSFMIEEAKTLEISEEFQLLEEWKAIQDLIYLKLTRKEIDWMKGFQFKEFVDRLSKIRSKLILQNEQVSFEQIEQLIREAISFYEFALKRDQILVGNTLSELRMKSHLKSAIRNPQSAILITGGFHTSGIEEILESKGMSYVILTPKVKKLGSEEIYEKLMNLEEYDFANVEFSEKRLALRMKKENGQWTLATPALFGSILEAIAKGNYEGELKRFFTEMLDQEEVRAQRLNELLNVWMQEGKNREFLDALDSEQMKRLLDAVAQIYPDEISAQVAKLDAESFTQREITLGAFKASYGELYSGLVSMVEIYFRKTSDRGPFESVEAALEAYRVVYGEPDPEIWPSIRYHLPDYEEWVKQFGLRDLIELGRVEKKHRRFGTEHEFFNKSLPLVKKIFGDELPQYWPGVVRLGIAAGENIRQLFEEEYLGNVKPLFGEDLPKYWPDLVELGVAAKGSNAYLFHWALPSLKKSFEDEFERYWPSFVKLGLIAGPASSALLGEGLSIVKGMIEDEETLMRIGQYLIGLVNVNDLLKVARELDLIKDEGSLYQIGKDLVQLEKASYESDAMLPDSFRKLKELFGDQFYEYWPEFVKIVIGGGVDSIWIFNYVFPALKEIIMDKESLREIGNELVLIGRNTGKSGTPLLQFAIPRLKKIITDLESLKNVGSILTALGEASDKKAITLKTVEGLIIDKESLERVGKILVNLNEAAGKNAEVLLGRGLPSLGKLIMDEESLARIGNDLVELGNEAEELAGDVIRNLSTVETLITDEASLKKTGSELLSLGKTTGKYASFVFGYLPTLKDYIFDTDSLRMVSRQIIELVKFLEFEDSSFTGRIVRRFFKDVLPKWKEAFGPKLIEFWSDLIELLEFGKATGHEEVWNIYEYGIPRACKVWDDNFQEMIETIKKFYKKANAEEQLDVLIKFNEIMKWSYRHPGQEEFIRERLTQIANRNFVNNTPQFVLPELNKFLAELEGKKEEPEEDEYAMARSVGGVIAPSAIPINQIAVNGPFNSVEEALKAYRAIYGEPDPESWKLIQDQLPDHEWWIKQFGLRDLLILAEVSKNNMYLFSLGLPALKEFSGDELNRYWPLLVEIGEGAGEKASALFQFGFPFLKEMISDEATLKRFGNDLVELSRAIDGWRYGNLLRALPEVKELFGEKFSQYWSVLVDLGKAAGEDAWIVFEIGLPNMKELIVDEATLAKIGGDLIKINKVSQRSGGEFKDGLPALKQAFGEKFSMYWPILVELGEAAEENVLFLFRDGLPTLKGLIIDEASLRQIGNDLIGLAEDAGKVSGELFYDGLPIVKGLIIDRASLGRVGNILVDLGRATMNVDQTVIYESLSSVKGLIVDERSLERVAKELVKLWQSAGGNALWLFKYGLSSVSGLIVDEESLRKIMQDLIELGKGIKFDDRSIFIHGLPFVKELIVDETSLKGIWRELIELWDAGKNSDGFLEGLKTLKKLFGDKFARYWPDIVELGKTTGPRIAKLFNLLSHKATNVWGEDLDQMMETIAKLYKKVDPKKQQKVLEEFIKILDGDWVNFYPDRVGGQEELIRERLTQIANRNFVNSTPQFVLPELEKFLEELKTAKAVPEGDEYAMAVVQTSDVSSDQSFSTVLGQKPSARPVGGLIVPSAIPISQIKVDGPFNSVEEALEAYQSVYGEPDPEIWDLIQKGLQNYEEWVRQFGVEGLIQLGKAAGKNAKNLFIHGLPSVKRLIVDRESLMIVGNYLIELGRNAGENDALVFQQGLPAVMALIVDEASLRILGPILIELGRDAGEDASFMFAGLPNLDEFIRDGESLRVVGEGLIELSRVIQKDVAVDDWRKRRQNFENFFQFGLPEWKRAFGPRLMVYWADLLAFAKAVGENAIDLFIIGIPMSNKVWDGNLDEMMGTVKKLYEKVSADDQPEVLGKFTEIMEWDNDHPGQEELIRERITQIANRNFVNNTPEFVLPELEKFLEELQSTTVASGEGEDEYAMAVAQTSDLSSDKSSGFSQSLGISTVLGQRPSAKPVEGLIVPSAIPVSQLKVKGPFNSVEEALEAYRAVYGEPDPEIWKSIQENLPDYEEWVRQFGLKDLFDLDKSAGILHGRELFKYGLPTVKKLFGDQLKDYWQDLVILGKVAGPNAGLLFEGVLPEVKKLFGDQWREYWPDLVDLGKIAGQEVAKLFRYGLPAVKDLFQDQLKVYWPDLLALEKAAGSRAWALFAYGLPAVKKLILDRKSLISVGNDLVTLGNTAGQFTEWEFLNGLLAVREIIVDRESLMKFGRDFAALERAAWQDSWGLFSYGLRQASQVWSNDLDTMLETIKRLYEKVSQKEKADVLRKFDEFMKWSEEHPGQQELIRERLTQIANRNFVNNTPQFVLPELEKFLKELKREQAVPEGDEYARAMANEGFIAQGTEAIAEFREKLGSSKHLFRRSEFDKEFKDVLDGHEVYIMPAIVKGKDDFVLGYRDIKNKRIYVAEEVLGVLRISPPEERKRLLKEYLYHEAHESSFAKATADKDPTDEAGLPAEALAQAGHYQLIAKQQALFKENYKSPSYVMDSRGYLIDPSNKTIAKGDLQKTLRFVIDGMIKLEEELEAYKKTYGDPDPMIWRLIKKNMIPYVELMARFGMRSLIEIGNSTERPYNLFEYGLPTMKELIKDEASLRKISRELIDLDEAVGQYSPHFFDVALPELKKTFDEKFEQYWPVFIDLAKAAEAKSVEDLFYYSFRALKDFIKDEVTLRRVGEELIALGKVTKDTKRLFQSSIPMAIRLWEDDPNIMLDTVKRLYEKVDPEDQSKVLDKLFEITSLRSSADPALKEAARERLTQIANRNFVNNTPEFVLPELEKYLAELQGAKAEPEGEDEDYAFMVPKVDGYISQGTLAVDHFIRRLSEDLHKEDKHMRHFKRDTRLEAEYADVLEGHEVYVMSALVKEADDFVLGSREVSKKKIYLCEEVLLVLRQAPPEEANRLIREYLWHEAHENPSDLKDHNRLIPLQQKQFKENYEGRGYVPNSDGILEYPIFTSKFWNAIYSISPAFVLWTNKVKLRIAKGALGERLRLVINTLRRPYETVDQAMEAYRTIYGEPDPKIVSLVQGALPKYEKWVKELGIKEFFEFRTAAGNNEGLLERGFPTMELLFIKGSFIGHWPSFLELIKVAGKDAENLFLKVIPEAKKFWKIDMTDMVETLKKLYEELDSENRMKGIDEFIKVLDYRSITPELDDWMEDQINRILRFDIENGKPQFIIEEFKKLLLELSERRERIAFERGHYIAQGVEAIVELRRRLKSSEFLVQSLELEREFPDVLDSHTVYVMPAIVKYHDDFVLGYRDIENKRIYIAEEMLRAIFSASVKAGKEIMQSPLNMEELLRLTRNNNRMMSLLREYLWHEAHEDSTKNNDHLSLIAQQQVKFKENYQNPGYKMKPDGQLIDPDKNNKIAKGELGDRLRFVINGILRSRGPFDSFYEALESYTQIYGSPRIGISGREIFITDLNNDMISWITRFGIKEFLDLVQSFRATLASDFPIENILEEFDAYIGSFNTALQEAFSEEEVRENWRDYLRILGNIGYPADIAQPLPKLIHLLKAEGAVENPWQAVSELVNIVRDDLYLNYSEYGFKKHDLDNVWQAFFEGFYEVSSIFEGRLKKYWPFLVELVNNAKGVTPFLFSTGLPQAAFVWEPNLEDMVQAINKLCDKASAEERVKIMDAFTDVMNWTLIHLYGKDELRERVTQIANRNFVNNTPQYVLPELKEFSEKLEKGEAISKEDEYALVRGEGYIVQGTEALKEFKENLENGRYEKKRYEGIERLFPDILDGHEVYVIPAIIKGPDDFVLGFRDIAKKQIYITKEVLYALRREPPEEKNRLLREYLWHESHESSVALAKEDEAPNIGTSHYQLIARQQELFKENYKNPQYKPSSAGYLVDPDKDNKIAKGDLGDRLRFVIDGVIRNRRPFDSVEEALTSYEQLYGLPDSKIWQTLQTNLPNWEDWIKEFGIMDIMDLAEVLDERDLPLFFEITLPSLKGLFLENLSFYWPDMVAMGKNSGKDAIWLLNDGVPEMKRLLGEDFKFYWPGLSKLILAAAYDRSDGPQFDQGIVTLALPEVIKVFGKKLKKYWPQIVEMGLTARPTSWDLLSLGLSRSKKALGRKFFKYWPVLKEFVKKGEGWSYQIFAYGLPSMKEFIKDETSLRKIFEDLLMLANAQGDDLDEGVSNLFKKSLRELKIAFGNEFSKYWPRIVELGQAIGRGGVYSFFSGEPDAILNLTDRGDFSYTKEVWSNDLEALMSTLEKLYWTSQNDASKALEKFQRIMLWSDNNQGQEELVRERLTQIANRNFVNNTPQFVLPELEKFLAELQATTAAPREEDDEYAMAKPVGGLIVPSTVPAMSQINVNGPFNSVEEALQTYRTIYGEPDPEIWKLIQENLPDYEWWVKEFGINDLVEFGKTVRITSPWLFKFGLPAVKDLIVDRASLERIGQDLVELGRIHGNDSGWLYKFGLRVAGQTFGKELEKYWTGLVGLLKVLDSEQIEFLISRGRALEDVKQIFGEGQEKYWPKFVELVKIVAASDKGNLAFLQIFHTLHRSKAIWGGLEEMLLVVDRLYRNSAEEHQSKILYSFARIMNWSDKSPGQEELIRERLTQIANRNFVNNTPEFVVPELEKFLMELKTAQAVPEGDEYALAGAGYIAQGTEAMAEFRENLERGNYELGIRNQELEKKHADVLDGHEVYVIPAIVKGPNDFLLGHRDIANKRIYIAEELLLVLQRSPPEEANRLLREYLWHESHENSTYASSYAKATEDKKALVDRPAVSGVITRGLPDEALAQAGHYQLIAQQQVKFHENYKDRGYQLGSEGYLIDPENVDPESGKPKIAKGALGEKLRFVIDAVIKNRAPFNTIEEALEAYRNIYGDPDREIWELMSGQAVNELIGDELVEFRSWIMEFGVKDILELGQSVTVTKDWAEKYFEDDDRFYKRAGELKRLLSSLKDLKVIFKEKLGSYWPILVELGKAAEEDYWLIYQRAIPAMRHLIRDEESLRRIGNDLIALNKSAGKEAFTLFSSRGLSRSSYKMGAPITPEDSDLSILEHLQGLFGSKFEEYWPSLVQVGKASRDHMVNFFASRLSEANEVWNGDVDSMMDSLQRLYEKSPSDDQFEILDAFGAIVSMTDKMLNRNSQPDSELIRERLTQIANRNFVNNTPQFVLPELEKFLEELNTAAKGVPDEGEDEYAIAKPVGGIIVPSAVPISQIKVDGPFSSVEEALEAYRAVYGEPDKKVYYGDERVLIWKLIQEKLPDYEGWIRQFGLKSLIEIGEVAAVDATSLFEYSLPELKMAFGDRFEEFWPVFVDLGKKAGPEHILVLLRFGLPSVKKIIQDRETLKRVGEYLIDFASRALTEGPYKGRTPTNFTSEVFMFGFKHLEGLIVDEASLSALGDDLLRVGQAIGPWKLEGFFDSGLKEAKKFFGNKLGEYWPILVELGVKAGADAGVFFTYGLTIIKELVKDEASLKAVGQDLIDLLEVSEAPPVGLLRGLAEIKDSFAKEDEVRFARYWTEIVEAGKVAGKNAQDVFSFGLPNAVVAWGNDVDEMMSIMNKLYEKSTKDDRRQILEKFTEIMKWRQQNAQEELIRERLAQIANRNFVNNTPQFVLQELDQFLKVLEDNKDETG